MPSSREGVGRGPALEIDVMMGFVMQAVVREGERRGALGLESERQRVEGLLSTLSQRGGVNLTYF